MFVCTECVKDFEGSSIDWAKKANWTSWGSCEFCRTVNNCYDLYSGDPNWYRKEKQN